LGESEGRGRERIFAQSLAADVARDRGDGRVEVCLGHFFATHMSLFSQELILRRRRLLCSMRRILAKTRSGGDVQ